MFTKYHRYTLNWFTSMPIQLLLVIVGVLFFADYLPHAVARGFYTLSLMIKDMIMTVLPLAVFAFIAATLMHFQKRALLLVLVLLIFEGFSNGASLFYAYGMAHALDMWIPTFHVMPQQDFQLVPFFQIGTPPLKFWSTPFGVMAGMGAGLCAAFFQVPQLTQTILTTRLWVGKFFSKVITRVIPLYVLGFMIFMQHSGLLDHILNSYGLVITLVMGCLIFYLSLILFVATYVGKNSFAILCRHIVPTSIIAASTMSSAATMPFTIAAAERNLRNRNFAQMLIPATTNIQQVGDCIANAFLCLVILKNFGKPFPGFMEWCLFVGVFTMARYATTAILGGAIFMMIPIYKAFLGFNDEMIAIILALNIVLDPLITASNVAANGGLAVIFEALWIRINGISLNDHSFKTKHLMDFPYTVKDAQSKNESQLTMKKK